ncbi:hypothetical protein BWQ93_18485 [Sphingopyxis sp. QXT-31]|uniref:hypothetical protein n=1 Tax=Sphingopyxis sp. QXT-31 TaxID=1357916 RepID=UPI000979145C|nr:hypothetical protein [Sphingopyxis sp. QXT-31]AQA00224.1 hypothetical protein BWQ93_18485 [Sphingopyxis sp. QXT-31]
MDNASTNADDIRAVRDRLRSELRVLDRLGQNLAANALSHAIDLLNDGRGAIGSNASITGETSP